MLILLSILALTWMRGFQEGTPLAVHTPTITAFGTLSKGLHTRMDAPYTHAFLGYQR